MFEHKYFTIKQEKGTIGEPIKVGDYEIRVNNTDQLRGVLLEVKTSGASSEDKIPMNSNARNGSLVKVSDEFQSHVYQSQGHVEYFGDCYLGITMMSETGRRSDTIDDVDEIRFFVTYCQKQES